MDFREVCTVFGGTPFYDDLHTDLVTAHKTLEVLAADVSTSSVDKELSILLLRAIFSLLQGDFVSATRYLDSLCKDGLSPAQRTRWTFRGNAYSALVCIWREFPPLLQPCDLLGPALAMWTKRENYDNGAHSLTTCAQYEQDMSRIDVLEYNVIRAICFSHHMTRAVRGLHKRPSDCDFDLPRHKLQCSRFAKVLAQLNGVIQQSLQLGLPLIAAYLLRTQYNFARASGDPNAIRYLDPMKSIYCALEDDVGLGQYCLIRGDYVVSPGFTCPSLLNLVIIDSVDDYVGDSTMHFAENAALGSEFDTGTLDPKERIEKHCSSSRVWYTKAKEHFTRAHSTRGLATGTFREACTQRMRRMQPGANLGGSTHPEQISELLTESYSAAQRCYDKQLEALIEVHRLVHMGVSFETRSKTHRVAHWARDCGNAVFALGLALFALRLGHYNRYIVGSATHLEGYEVCRQIIKEIHVFWTVWYLAMLAQLRAWLSLGLHSTAAIWARHLKDSTYLMFTYDMTIDVSAVNLHTIHLITKAVVEAVVLLVPTEYDASKFPDEATQKILEDLSHNPFMSQYADDARTKLRHAAATTAYRRNLQDGDFKAAQCALQNFVDESESETSTKLGQILLKIDILHQAGDFDRARGLMSQHVSDDDMFTIIPPSCVSSQDLVEAMIKVVQQCRLKSLEAIFLSCIKLKFWQRAVQLMSTIEETSPGYFTSVTSYTELWPWQRCLYAGLVRESQRDFHEAYLYFLQGWAFLLDLAAHMTDDDFRLVLAKNDATRLLGSAARRALLWKQDMPGYTTLGPTSNLAVDCSVFRIFAIRIHYKDFRQHLMEALAFLEAARPQYMWSDEAGEYTSEQAEAEYKSELWKELMRKEHRSPEEEVEFKALDPLREEYLAVFHQTAPLRKKTRKLSFGSVASLFRGVPKYAIVLYIFATQEGCISMALDEVTVRMAIFVPQATLAALEETVIMFVDAIKNNHAGGIEYFGRILDRILVEPLRNIIARRPHVIFVLSGILTRIPLCALRYDGDYLIMQREVSQVPSLRALYSSQSRRLLQSRIRPTMSVVARPGGPRDRWLPMAAIEASLMGKLLNTPAINAKDVGREDFRSLVRESGFLHICTHGLQDADHPLNSQILLREKFRVLDLLAVRGDVALVTFSACHSGVGHASDSGDVQGFSHAVLAAGAHAYLGALWKVNDVATMIHMWIFYTNLLLFREQPSLSEAWQFATKALYNMTTDIAIRLLEQFVELLDISKQHEDHVAGLAGKKEEKKLLQVIKSWKEGKDIIDFKEPRIWAPFVMVGNASQRIWTSRQWLEKELSNYREIKHDASLKEFIAYCKSVEGGRLKDNPFWEDAIQTGCWEGEDEAPVPKEFIYRS